MSVKELRSLINGEVLSDEASLRLYSYDATPIKIERQTPLCVVLPTSEEDVINLVSYCYERNIPIFPRGAGSGLTGGAVPTQKGVVVSFERMNSLEIDKENAVAIAQPGVITSKLQEAAESVGLFYPPDPSSYKYSTIGGNVAENAGGPRCFKYGVTREYVLGLRAVIKEGKVLQTGAPVIKDVAGYDLTKFLVGSEGTLGLITSITLKLIPKPKARASALLIFDSISNLSEATTRIITGGLFPSALEFMDEEAISVVKAFSKVPIPSAKALLLVELDGTPSSLKEQLEDLEKLVKPLTSEFRLALDSSSQEALWSARKSLGPALARIASGKINEDIVVPRSKLATFLECLKDLSNKHSLKVVVFGHIGDGNLHANILYDKSDPSEEHRAELLVDELFELTLLLGGSITGEHGVGITKRKF
ncbi:MAG: FAD-linked oxidase C-terminal domain-containing protein, partial [Aquificaceae bacterium]|nr:FAD-linked oxidase C-terminal domain-containing protein [Aquificaceae bacterium]